MGYRTELRSPHGGERRYCQPSPHIFEQQSTPIPIRRGTNSTTTAEILTASCIVLPSRTVGCHPLPTSSTQRPQNQHRREACSHRKPIPLLPLCFRIHSRTVECHHSASYDHANALQSWETSCSDRKPSRVRRRACTTAGRRRSSGRLSSRVHVQHELRCIYDFPHTRFPLRMLMSVGGRAGIPNPPSLSDGQRHAWPASDLPQSEPEYAH